MALPFPFTFVSRQPGAPLRRCVERIWYARGTVPYARERIAPTGSAVAVVVLGDPIVQIADNGAGEELVAERGFLVGPHDRPTINAPTGETHAVGIVTTAVGCEAVFGIRPAILRGRTVDLEGAWPSASTLRAALLATSGPEAALDAVERHLQARTGPVPAGYTRCVRAVSMLEADPLRPIAEVAAALEISHGHLDREFTRIVGQSPRALARLLRLRRLLQVLDVRGDIGWGDVAQAYGWFDQAHMIRDFKRHTGVTPTAYVAAQRAAYGAPAPGVGAGFAPEVDPT